MPINHPLKGLCYYYMAGVHARNGDIWQCSNMLKKALVSLNAHKRSIVRGQNVIDTIKVIAQQQSSITPDIALEGNPCRINIEENSLNIGNKQGVIFTTCNQTYFDRFANEFAESVDPQIVAHIHIVNPEKDNIHKLSEYENRYPNLFISYDFGPEEASYYACRRFQLINSVLKKYQKNVIVSDIDVTFTGETKKLLNMKSFHCGLFKAAKLDPMQIMHLSLSVYEFTEETINFTEDLSNYLTLKMKDGFPWMLDQCAFLTCGLLHENKQRGFKIVDLNKTLTHGLTAYQVNQVSTVTEKYDLRNYNTPQSHEHPI